MSALPRIDSGVTVDDRSTIADWREMLAAELEVLSPAQGRTAMAQAVEDTGGIWVPTGADTWGPHYAEITVGGVMAQGEDLDACIASWIKHVVRISRADQEAA